MKMAIDIILFAAIAVFFVFKLRQVLGQKHGEERERPNPFATQADNAAQVNQPNTIDGKATEASPEMAAQASSMAAPNSVAGGITQIKILDPSFNEKQFITNAKTAFTMIVEAFAKGDEPTLEMLLRPDVLKSFKTEIKRRLEAGEDVIAEVKKITVADIAAARVEGRMALVTVDFTSEQLNYTKNAAGEVIDGDAGRPIEIAESWTFERDTRSKTPEWFLVATKTL